MFLGDFPEDFTTVTCMFTTHASTGAPVAPSTAFEAADVIIYKNGSATQKTSTNGVTMTSPFDTITGLHCVVIDTSNDTGDGGFWVAGAQYTLVLSPDETVDSLAVAKVIGTFGIELAEALRPTTAGRQLDVTATGAAGIDWGNVENPTTAVNLSATNIDVDQVVASVSGAVGSVTGTVGSVTGAVGSVTGAVGSVTGNVGGNVVGSVASVTAGVTLAASAVQAIWDALTTALTTVGSVGKLLVDNVNATISSRATQTSVDDLPTNAELATSQAAADDATLAAIAALNNLSTAEVKTQVVAALNTDTYAEPAQGAPGATITLAAKIGYLYKAFRNKKTVTATTFSLFNDDAVTVDHKSTISDDATTYTETEKTTGP